MIDLLNMKMDDIVDLQTKNQQQIAINTQDHYEVEAHGVTLLSTMNKEEATRIYRESQDTDKKVIRIWKGKRLQILPRGWF
jgi:hypothetical protein